MVTNSQYDYKQGKIRSQRNLEDFARLWICGVPALPADYSVTLSWHKTYSWYDPLLNDGVLFTNVLFQGSPAIKLYRAYESDGGTRYLTDTNTAAFQIAPFYLEGNLIMAYGQKLATISTNQSYTFPAGFFDGSNKHFLFEGAGIGSGELQLTIWQGTNVVGRTSAWLELHDVHDMYEYAMVTNVIQSWPEMVQQNPTSGFRIVNSQAIESAETNLAVFVHGWRVGEWESRNFADTMFKRLYWEGFQGRYAAINWLTRSSDSGQFNCNIQTPQVRGFYSRLQQSLFSPAP